MDMQPDGDRRGTPGGFPEPLAQEREARLRRVLPLVFWIALAARLMVFPFAENKHADAPMRALIAERMNLDPIAGSDPRSYCQFGPLPIELLRPVLRLDPDARRSSRALSLLAGLATFLPFFALGRRMVGAGPALTLAGVGLALSPLHIQVSTTAASEAIYLLILLAALDRLHRAVSEGSRSSYVVAGLLASLAAVTRYDTWLAVPVGAAAALLFGRRDRRAVLDVLLFVGLAALLPVAYLVWSWAKTGDPFFFARYITQDHATAAQAVTERLGGGLARLRQVAIWLVSFAAAMTPVLFLALAVAARRLRTLSPGTRVVLAMALAPPAAYLAKGILFGDFEPLPRFAIAPGAVLLPVAAAALLSVAWFEQARRSLVVVAAGALAMSAVALALAFGRGGDRIWAGAESIGPLTRLDHDDRAVAAHLLRHRRPQESVYLDTLGYVDVAVAHAARVPAPLSATLAHTRLPPATLAASRRTTGASWFAVHDHSWGKSLPADWPVASERLGGWRLVHVPAPAAGGGDAGGSR